MEIKMKGENPIWFESMDSNSPPLINTLAFLALIYVGLLTFQ